MELNPAKRQQISDPEKETQARLDKMLTPEQQKILMEACPPRFDEGGRGGLMEREPKPGEASHGRPAGKPGRPSGDQGPIRPQRPLRPAG